MKFLVDEQMNTLHFVNLRIIHMFIEGFNNSLLSFFFNVNHKLSINRDTSNMLFFNQTKKKNWQII